MGEMADAPARAQPSAHGLARLSPAEAAAVLGALFAASDVGLGVWDRELRYRAVNDALAEVNGIAPAEHLGRTVQDVLGTLGDELAPLFRRVMGTGEPVLDLAVAGETPKAPGRVRRWRASFHPVGGPPGEVLGVVATVVEVTATREAQESERRATREARAAGALIDAVFAAAPVGLAVWTPDLRYQRINRALAAMNGLSVEEHLGRRLEEVLRADSARVRPLIERVVATGEPVIDAEIPMRRAGGLGYYEASYFPVLGVDDAVTAVAAVIRDVSERRRAERERARLLKDALTARAQAEAAQVRAETAQRAAEDARARTAFLARVGARMAASRDLGATLQEVAAATVPEMADWCMLTLVEADGGLSTAAIAHADPSLTERGWEVMRRHPLQPDDPAGPARVIRTGESELLPDLTDEMLAGIADGEEHLALLRRLGLRSSLVVPLRRPGRVLGALTLLFAESRRRFGEDEISLARALAARASLHIQNARLHDELAHIASTLQRSLLPGSLPDVPHLDIGTRYLPVGEHNEVGGDFYDLFRTEPGVWTALIGDVSGKGAEAAAITSLARHTLRAAAMRDPDPVENLRLLNETMLADTNTSRFCTVSYGRLRPSPGELRVVLANGGHMPPLVVRSDGTVEHIDVPGALVGALPAAPFSSREIRLGPGELLLLYTDGVTDLRTRGPRSGERQLARTLERVAGAGVEETLDAVATMAVEAQDGKPRDDIALLAFRVTPP